MGLRARAVFQDDADPGTGSIRIAGFTAQLEAEDRRWRGWVRLEAPIERVNLGPPGNTVYVAEPNAVPLTRTLLSAFDSSGCVVFTSQKSVIPAVPLIDLNTLFTGPFKVRKGM